MKKTIIIMGAAALISLGTTARADEPGSGHTTEVIPGDWDDEDQKLTFEFQDVPEAKFTGLHLNLICGLPDAKILYTTNPNAKPEDTDEWTEYTEPIYLTTDCTVRFFARCEGYDDSAVQEFEFVFADHQTLAPTIAPDIDRANLIMVCETSDAEIRYTTDGSDPTSESTLYEGPVLLEANGLFRARAFAKDLFDSDITDYTVDFLTVTPPSAVFENKALVLTSEDPKVNIWYTTDTEASPETTDAWTPYTAPVALTENCSVRFFGQREGYNDSEVQNFDFAYTTYQVIAPQLETDAAGTHVVMTSETEGAEIRYTTDGSDPTQESPLYSEPVEIVSNGIFRARAFANGMFDSNIVDFTVMHMAVPTPTAEFVNKMLVLSCGDPKSTIWYTTNPDAAIGDTDAWTEYKNPLELTENCVVRFFGSRNNFNDSDIQSFSFVYSNYRVADPTIERNAEGTHIVMETTTPGATIHYTTDGSEPTDKSPVYSEPVLIEGNFTFSAIAVADGMFDSKSNRYVVSNMAVPVPFANFENLKMSLTCSDEKAQIWYTTNPEATLDDIAGWTLYTAPFDMTGDCTLRFFTRRDNFNDSDIESLTFVYSAYQAQAPSIDRNDQGTHIVMATAVEGGQIRYTTDGSEPTAESALYEKAFRLQEGAVYRAKVFVDGMYASEISEYIIGSDHLAVPTAAYDNFTLVLNTADEGASIWYTTDPELSLDDVEAWTLYDTPIALTDDCTYRFFAGDDDANASDVQTFVFQRSDWQVAVPTIERNEEGTHIVIETPTEDAEIRYTTDGSEPTAESTLYTEPVLIECNGTFRARGFVKGLFDSEVTDFVVANMACPVAYASFEDKLLTLSCADPQAEIWYTNDDDAVPEEMENWELYTGPVALTENCYVHFFTRRDNFNDSDIETFVFLRANYLANAPVIERSEDGREILMSSDIEGAEIRYTTDGSEPTQESELYTEPVFLTQNCTFRARTFADGLFESEVSEYSVSNLTMMMPHASFENLLLTLSVWDDAASIWYSLDAEANPENAEAWTLYTEPIALTEDCTVSFFARRTGFLDSSISTFNFAYADYQAAMPEIEYNDGLITITCETEGAEIHYTTDGTEPTAESPVYSEPIVVECNGAFNAIAIVNDMFDSKVSTLEVSDMTSATPAAAFEAKALVLSCQDENALILYTTNPEASVDDADAWTVYTEPIALTEDCTVSFFSRRDKFNDSEISTFEFVYTDYQAAMPVIEYADGLVTITCETEGAEIHYTTDGTEPTAESPVYSEPLVVEGNATYSAIAIVNDMFDSKVNTIEVSDMTVTAPVAAFEAKALVLSCQDENAMILYTTNPEASVDDADAWTVYTEPIALAEDCTVSFFSRRDKFNDSEISTFEFVYTDYQAAMPVIEYADGLVTITCETEGAEIHYTTDGTEPTAESPVYSEPLIVEGNATYSAIAIVDDMFDSKVNSYEISDMTVTAPGAEFVGKALMLTCPDEKAMILYTTNPEASVDDADAWTVYTEPIALTEDCTVSFFSRRDKFNDSEVSIFEFVYADYQAAMPVIEYADGIVTITCETEDAEIRYTTDGSEPTAESELYTGPITVTRQMTVRACAITPEHFASEIAELTVDITTGIFAVTAEGTNLRITNDGADLVIYSDKALRLPVYTINGTLIRILDVENGRNVVTDLVHGIYIIAGQKIMH